MSETLRGTWYLLITSVIGIAWASALVSLLATGVGTLVIVVGAFILLVTARLVHLVEDAEVARAARFLRTEVAGSGSDRIPGPAPATLPARLRNEWTSRTCRRALVGLLRMAIGPVLLSVMIVLWAVPLGLAATPILTAAGLEPTGWTDHIASVVDIGRWPAAVAMSVVGIVLVPLAAVAVRRLATVLAATTLAASSISLDRQALVNR